jgi:hypothetical protein
MLNRLPFLISLAALAYPAASKIAAGSGDFAVTVNGVTYNPAVGKSVKLSDFACSGLIGVRGVHVAFDVDCTDLGVYNYTLTGSPDAQRK